MCAFVENRSNCWFSFRFAWFLLLLYLLFRLNYFYFIFFVEESIWLQRLRADWIVAWRGSWLNQLRFHRNYSWPSQGPPSFNQVDTMNFPRYSRWKMPWKMLGKCWTKKIPLKKYNQTKPRICNEIIILMASIYHNRWRKWLNKWIFRFSIVQMKILFKMTTTATIDVSTEEIRIFYFDAVSIELQNK